MGFAPPPYGGFALLASAHRCAWLQAHSLCACYECTIHAHLAPRNTAWRPCPHMNDASMLPCVMRCLMPALLPKGDESAMNPWRKFRECPFHALR